MKRKEEAPAKGADTVKEWMEAHPQEYARFAAKMKTEGIGGVLKLGEDAFRLSPDFQQEVERMVTSGRFDVSSLLEHLTLSDFAENYLREKNEDHMAMAAWVKYGESAPEQVADESWHRTNAHTGRCFPACSSCSGESSFSGSNCTADAGKRKEEKPLRQKVSSTCLPRRMRTG